MSETKPVSSNGATRVVISDAFSPLVDMTTAAPEEPTQSAYDVYVESGKNPQEIYASFIHAMSSSDAHENDASLAQAFAIGLASWEKISDPVDPQKFDAMFKGLYFALGDGLHEDNHRPTPPLNWDDIDIRREAFLAIGGDLFEPQDFEEGSPLYADTQFVSNLSGFLSKWSELSEQNLGRNMVMSKHIRNAVEEMLGYEDAPPPAAVLSAANIDFDT